MVAVIGDIGHALWPAGFHELALPEIRLGCRPRWNALFQQRPTPPGSQLAQTLWFPVVQALPAGELRYCRFWDVGGDAKKANNRRSDPDWTVGAKLARAPDGRIFIVDLIRVQATSGDVDRLIKQTALLDGHECAVREEQEGGSSGLAIIKLRKKGLAGALRVKALLWATISKTPSAHTT